MNWTDATTYSRGDNERKQTAWEWQTEYLRIYITNAHVYYPNLWVIVCHEAGIREAKMKISGDSTPEKAQETALKIVKNRLNKMLNSLPE